MQAGPANGASRGLPSLVSTVAPVQQVLMDNEAVAISAFSN